MSFGNGSTGSLVEDCSSSVFSFMSMFSLICVTFNGAHTLVDICCSCNGREGSSTEKTLSSSRLSATVVRLSSPLALADY